MKKTFILVMLPTKKESNLGLYSNGKLYNSTMGSKTDDWENQQLYAISEEELKEGEIGILDWEGKLNPNDMRVGTVEKISPNFEIRNQHGNLSIPPNDGRFPNNKKYKVVATNDKSLTTLLFDESFMDKYAERYNLGIPINKIELEMETPDVIKSNQKNEVTVIATSRN